MIYVVEVSRSGDALVWYRKTKRQIIAAIREKAAADTCPPWERMTGRELMTAWGAASTQELRQESEHIDHPALIIAAALIDMHGPDVVMYQSSENPGTYQLEAIDEFFSHIRHNGENLARQYVLMSDDEALKAITDPDRWHGPGGWKARGALLAAMTESATSHQKTDPAEAEDSE